MRRWRRRRMFLMIDRSVVVGLVLLGSVVLRSVHLLMIVLMVVRMVLVRIVVILGLVSVARRLLVGHLQRTVIRGLLGVPKLGSVRFLRLMMMMMMRWWRIMIRSLVILRRGWRSVMIRILSVLWRWMVRMLMIVRRRRRRRRWLLISSVLLDIISVAWSVYRNVIALVRLMMVVFVGMFVVVEEDRHGMVGIVIIGSVDRDHNIVLYRSLSWSWSNN